MSHPTLILHHYWRSSCSWRVRWALNIKGIPFDSLPINLLKSAQQEEQYLAKNPAGFVPTLVFDGTPFAESMAIIEWIEEKWKEPALLPTKLEDRMRVRQLYMAIAAGTQPVQNLAVQKYYSEDKSKRIEFARHWIIKGLNTYETLLDQLSRSSLDYSFGEQASMADLCLIPQCYNALRFGVDLHEFRKVKRIYEFCISTDACSKAAPENQEGAE